MAVFDDDAAGYQRETGLKLAQSSGPPSLMNKTSSKQSELLGRFKWLLIGLMIGTGIVLFFSFPEEPLSRETILGLLAFSFLIFLVEGFSLKVPLGNAYLGLSGTIFGALIILFNPFWAATAAFSALLLAEIAISKRKLNKSLFNSTQTALSVFVGSIVLGFIAGGDGLDSSVLFFIGFAVAILSYWLINTWLVSFGAQALYGEKPQRFWERNFKWTFLYEFTSAPIALAVAYAYDQLWLIGLLLVALPILMLRNAYSQYIELKKTYRETVRTLVKIIEMHDPYTAGHSDRVAKYSRELCEALRLSPAITEKVELAAYLHDLGKINLDLSGIVRKAAKLTEEERRLIRLHSVVSADLANQVSFFQGEIEAMIRHHHENWDGSGYPHGLSGEDIPRGSRIILIADAFDAMTTSRVYRDALDLKEVKAEFEKFAGVQFDPEMVPVFLEEVVGNGEGIISQPVSEPIEGQRSRQKHSVAKIHSISGTRVMQ